MLYDNIESYEIRESIFDKRLHWQEIYRDAVLYHGGDNKILCQF